MLMAVDLVRVDIDALGLQDLEAHAWRDNRKGTYFRCIAKYAKLTHICRSDQFEPPVGSVLLPHLVLMII